MDPIRPRRRLPPLSALLAAALAACGGAQAAPAPAPAGGSRPLLVGQASGTTALLQAVAPVDARVAWVSGHEGTWARTVDGGRTWTAGRVPGADTLQFRDVEALGDRTAWLLSAGTGDLSRIYRTDDAGATWTLQYRMDHPEGFLDCMAFWDGRRGIAYGDAVDGGLFVLRTDDGGATWTRVPPASLPPAGEGEGGFAASGAGAVAGEDGRGWVGTGNGPSPRVLATSDHGRTWRSAPVPLEAGEGAGVTALAMGADGRPGFALGGRLGDAARGRSVAVTEDGGATWTEGGRLAMAGPAYGAARVPGVEPPLLVAAGPSGLDWSSDGGRTWRTASTASHWAVAFASPGVGWAVGPEGRITRVSFVGS